jgi:hypothetical protein
MVEAVLYASLLGVVIPLFAFQLLRSAYRSIIGRKGNHSQLFTWSNLATSISLAVACIGFQIIANSLSDESHGVFDPYDILQITASSNTTEIKRAYRTLSLEYHPDKNPGPEAAKKFNRIATAYRALTDSKAKQNWKLFGHPDGPQRWSYDIAFPKWIQPGKDASSFTIASYLMGYLLFIVFATFGAKRAILGSKSGETQGARPTTDDLQVFLKALVEMKPVCALEILLAIAHIPQLLPDTAALEEGEGNATLTALQHVSPPPTTQFADATVKSNVRCCFFHAQLDEELCKNMDVRSILDGKRTGESAFQNILLLLQTLYLRNKADLPPSLVQEQTRMLELAEPLLDAAFQIAAKSGAINLMTAIVEAKALVRRKLWSHSDEKALNLQAKEMEKVETAVPQISVQVTDIGTWGESQTAIGDKVTATITLRRHHADKYMGLSGLTPDTSSPVVKGEPWWIFLLAKNQDETLSLVGLQPCLGQLEKKEVSASISFLATKAGTMKYRVLVKSPVFVGVDQSAEAELIVCMPDDLHSEIEDEEEEDECYD